MDAQTIKAANCVAQVPCPAQVLKIACGLHQNIGLLQNEWSPQKICEDSKGSDKDPSDGQVETRSVQVFEVQACHL